MQAGRCSPKYGLPDNPDRPLIGIVSRFAAQKGFDLLRRRGIASCCRRTISLVVLGSGDPHYESMFRALAQTCPDKVGLRIGYDNSLVAPN